MDQSSAERDLARMLAGLSVSRRQGTYTFVTVDPADRVEITSDQIAASVVEDEGLTLVIETAVAERLGRPIEFEAAWLTLGVHSALEAVGLTAAVAGALARAGIAANVVAGYHHDHLLVPVDRADEAIAALEGLAAR